MLPYLERAEHADAGLYQGDPDATTAMAVDERSHARVLTRLRNTDHPGGIRKVERWHRVDRSGALRAGVFGVKAERLVNGGAHRRIGACRHVWGLPPDVS